MGKWRRSDKTHHEQLLHLCADTCLDFFFVFNFKWSFSPFSDEFDSLVQTLRTFWMFAQGSPPAGRSHLNCFAAERRRIIRGSIDAVWMFYMVCVDVSGSKWPRTPQFVCQSAVPTIGSGFIFVFIFFTPRCAAYTCVFIHFKQHFVFNIGHPALLLWPLIQQNYHTDRLLLVCLVFFLSEPDKIFFYLSYCAMCSIVLDFSEDSTSESKL